MWITKGEVDVAQGAGVVDRANIIFDGVEPFEEHSWVGKHVRCGSVVLQITEPTIRCPATEVQPSGPNVGQRNLNPPQVRHV